MSALPRVSTPELPDLTYVGVIAGERYRVFILPGNSELPIRADLRNHSPDGFAWGYPGSGPAQLALALVAHATRDDALALRIYQAFKEHHVAAWDQADGWRCTAREVRNWVQAVETVRVAFG